MTASIDMSEVGDDGSSICASICLPEVSDELRCLVVSHVACGPASSVAVTAKHLSHSLCLPMRCGPTPHWTACKPWSAMGAYRGGRPRGGACGGVDVRASGEASRECGWVDVWDVDAKAHRDP